MDKFEKLKELIKDLSPEEVEKLKALLEGNIEESTTEEENVETEEVKTEPSEEVDAPAEPEESESVVSESEEPNEETPSEEPSEESEPEETTSTEETPAEEEPATGEEETAEEPATEETPAEEEKVEEKEETTTPPPAAEEDDIPIMQKGISNAVDEEEEVAEPSQNITAEDGAEIPVDYEQIIDGLNAKNAALEAENRMLKAKYEGAFGFSAKPSSPAKVNKLYDDDIEVSFHK